MIRINLLPVREERRRADLQQFAVMLVGVLLLAVALVSFFHWSLMGRISDTQAEIAQTQQQIDQFGPQLAKVKQYRDAKAQIERKLEVIERLDEERSGPVHVLDQLATHAPDRLWITRIEAKNMRIRIHGMSLDNELVALFLTALNDSAYFKEVELLETEAREQGGFKLNEFELSARITSPEAEKREAAARNRTASATSTGPLGTGR